MLPELPDPFRKGRGIVPLRYSDDATFGTASAHCESSGPCRGPATFDREGLLQGLRVLKAR